MLIFSAETSSRSKPLVDEGLGQLFKSIAILRIGAGATLGWFHGWPGVKGAYQFLWKEEPWAWVKVLDDAHVPLPHLAAPAAALMIASVAICWALGFATRVFAAVFIPMVIAGIVIAHRLSSTEVETGALYLAIAFTLLLFGSGNVSLDFFFKLGARPKELPKRR